MQQYNFPTIILSGAGSLAEFVNRIASESYQKILIVTDENLVKVGLVNSLTDLLNQHKIAFVVFSDIHPNPIEEDIEKGTQYYKDNDCDAMIAIGGGSPIDAAKVIRIMAVHSGEIIQYGEDYGGDKRIVNPMPPLYAIPTTAGTGSEVGRSGVIIMRKTQTKTIFFHPKLIPDIAVLDPTLTVGLPIHITAATGIDAFTHNLEAYFCPVFHPMADGIALEGLELILDWLPKACQEPKNLQAREAMQIAAAMGATAFQKGLGMIHSLAHPLSARYGLHHGLTNALLLPASVAFLENSGLSAGQRQKFEKIVTLFRERKLFQKSLARSCHAFIESIGIKMGLSYHGVPKNDLEDLSQDAFEDPCHQGNMIQVGKADLLTVYKAAF